MFDLRYHVASLTAVFLALVIGILVGVGLSGRGFVDDAERKNLTSQIDDLRRERDTALSVVDQADSAERALDEYASKTYGSLVRSRLRDEAVAVIFVGSADRSVAQSVAKAVGDAGGTLMRLRSVRVPLDGTAVDDALRARPGTFRGLAGPEQREALGRQLGRELVAGGATPAWDELTRILVEERKGPSRPPVGAVVIARSAAPQQGETQDFLTGLYRGIAGAGSPAVGVDPSSTTSPARPAFRRGGLSTVDSVDTPGGRLALVLLLAGAAPGNYGVAKEATDGILPAVAPANATSG